MINSLIKFINEYNHVQFVNEHGQFVVDKLNENYYIITVLYANNRRVLVTYKQLRTYLKENIHELAIIKALERVFF